MTTTTNNSSLQSVLCRESWHWDSRDENQIVFHVDGTGKLICRAELNVWIAAEFDWKLLPDSGSLDQAVDLSNPGEDKLLGQIQIQLTLTKRRIPKLGYANMSQYTINESLLKEEAFSPKTYTLSLESGVFRTPFDEMQTAEIPYTPKFSLRLTFDKSPYPPREEWKKPGGAPDAMKFWEWNKFCAKKFEDVG